jgi:hypothetical protein
MDASTDVFDRNATKYVPVFNASLDVSKENTAKDVCVRTASKDVSLSVQKNICRSTDGFERNPTKDSKEFI